DRTAFGGNQSHRQGIGWTLLARVTPADVPYQRLRPYSGNWHPRPADASQVCPAVAPRRTVVRSRGLLHAARTDDRTDGCENRVCRSNWAISNSSPATGP